MALVSDNHHMRELTLSSRCLFNARFIDSDTKEVLYSCRTPKVWFTRHCVTTLIRHTPPTDLHHSGSHPNSPAIHHPASPDLHEKEPVPGHLSPQSTLVQSPTVSHCCHKDGHGQKTEGGSEVEVTKIHWKCFSDTLFEHNFQMRDVNEVMEKTGHRPLRFDRTFKVHGASYKWDLGLAGFDAPTLKLCDSAETVIAKYHRPCLFTSRKASLELRHGSEDILDMIVMTLVWVEWRQKLRIAAVVPTAAIVV